MSIIEKTMKQIHFSINPKRNNKQQALDVIKKLKDVIPIERCMMKLRIVTNKKNKSKILDLAGDVESQVVDESGNLEIVFSIDPGHFRQLDELVSGTPKSQLHVLSIIETHENDDGD